MKEERKVVEDVPMAKPIIVNDRKYEPPSDLQGKSVEELEAILAGYKNPKVVEKKPEPKEMMQPNPQQQRKMVEKK